MHCERRKVWKLIRNYWSMSRYSYSSASAEEYVNVYASKKKAIERMKEEANDWLEIKELHGRTAARILLDTDDHVTVMAYDAVLDCWSLIDLIIKSAWIS